MRMLPPVHNSGSRSASPGKYPTRFGLASPNALLSALDFTANGASTLNQNKLIYSAVIGSRIKYARSKNERLENTRRDVLGWYNWFMGSSLIQTLIVLTLIPAISPKARDLMLNKLNPKVNPLKKLFLTFFDPSKLWLIITDKQLHQRREQIVRSMMQSNLPNKMTKVAQVQKLFGQTINLRALMTAIGMAYTLFAVGIGINLVNIALTRRNLRKQISGQTPQGNANNAVNTASQASEAASRKASSAAATKPATISQQAWNVPGHPMMQNGFNYYYPGNRF